MTNNLINHWIDGQEVQSKSGNTADVFNPATGEVTAQVGIANQEEIDATIASATKAAKEWGALSIAKVQALISKFRKLLTEGGGELAEITTREPGKVVSDALGETMRGQEVVDLATGFHT